MLANEIAALAAKYAKYSGWKLTAGLRNSRGTWVLDFKDPDDATSQSWLVLALGPMGLGLREVYGRMWHWNVSLEDMDVMKRALLACEKS